MTSIHSLYIGDLVSFAKLFRRYLDQKRSLVNPLQCPDRISRVLQSLTLAWLRRFTPRADVNPHIRIQENQGVYLYTLTTDETTSPIPTLTLTVETHLLYTSYQTISLSDSSDSINLFNLIPLLGLKDIHMAMEVYHMRLSQSPHESYEYSNYKTSPSYTSLFQFYHAVAVSSPLDHIILDQLLGIDPQTLAKSSVWTKFLPGQAVRENVDLSQFPYLCEGDGMQHVEVCYAILPINTFYQHILSIRSHPFVEQPFHTSYQHTLSTHPINTPYQHRCYIN